MRSLPPRGLPSHVSHSYFTLWATGLILIAVEVVEPVVLLLHDPVELVLVDLAIAVTVSLVNHLLNLVIVHVLAQLLGDPLQVLEGNAAGLIVVEQLEHL